MDSHVSACACIWAQPKTGNTFCDGAAAYVCMQVMMCGTDSGHWHAPHLAVDAISAYDDFGGDAGAIHKLQGCLVWCAKKRCQTRGCLMQNTCTLL